MIDTKSKVYWEAIMVIANEMPNGYIETVILNILSKGDSYGYDITSQIEIDGKGQIVINDSCIYTILNQLERDELITTYWGEGIGGARRRYYSITPNGRKEFQRKANEWRATIKVLNNLMEGDRDD